MRLRINHRTTYSFSRAVYLEPHTFRFRPRSDGLQQLLQFRLDIQPRPVLESECLDADGNVVVRAWFEGTVNRMEALASAVVETKPVNPFGYLLTGDPVKPVHAALAPYRDSTNVAEAVHSFAEELFRDSGGDTLRFLSALGRRIFETFQYEVRHDGVAAPSSVTLELGKGACRDLAVLFIDACRSQGLPARFVSGYQFGEDESEGNEMHAWAEVYLPGGGWRGYDPSHGIAAGEGLVAVAAALEPVMAAPVSGTFRGTGATQTMEFAIEISRETEDGEGALANLT